MVLSSVFDCRQSVWLKCFVFSAQSAQMAEPESSSSGGESGADGGEEEVPHKGRARPASVVSSATGLVISMITASHELVCCATRPLVTTAL